MTRGSGIAAWQIFSHKVMRFLAPFFSAVALLALATAALLGARWAQLAAIPTLLGIGAAAAGWFIPSLARWRPIRAALFLTVSMLAVAAAWFGVFTREGAALWAPTERP